MSKVRVGFANDGEQSLEIDVVSKWEPTNMIYIGDTTFFKVDGCYFSMKTVNFNEIYNKK